MHLLFEGKVAVSAYFQKHYFSFALAWNSEVLFPSFLAMPQKSSNDLLNKLLKHCKKPCGQNLNTLNWSCLPQHKSILPHQNQTKLTPEFFMEKMWYCRLKEVYKMGKILFFFFFKESGTTVKLWPICVLKQREGKELNRMSMKNMQFTLRIIKYEEED